MSTSAPVDVYLRILTAAPDPSKDAILKRDTPGPYFTGQGEAAGPVNLRCGKRSCGQVLVQGVQSSTAYQNLTFFCVACGNYNRIDQPTN